jgi:hypothetical protein
VEAQRAPMLPLVAPAWRRLDALEAGGFAWRCQEPAGERSVPHGLEPVYLGESGMAKHNPNKLQEHGRTGAFWEQQETPYCVPDVCPAF